MSQDDVVKVLGDGELTWLELVARLVDSGLSESTAKKNIADARNQQRIEVSSDLQSVPGRRGRLLYRVVV